MISSLLNTLLQQKTQEYIYKCIKHKYFIYFSIPRNINANKIPSFLYFSKT